MSTQNLFHPNASPTVKELYDYAKKQKPSSQTPKHIITRALLRESIQSSNDPQLALNNPNRHLKETLNAIEFLLKPNLLFVSVLNSTKVFQFLPGKQEQVNLS